MLTVYTAIYGKRDEFHPPTWRGEGVRFVLYTDQLVRKCPGVEIIRSESRKKLPERATRWLKTHPPSGPSLWIDGIYQLVGNPLPLFKKFVGDVGLATHPRQVCIYHEAIQCAARRKDDPDKILRQAMRYIADGYPSAAGMYAGGIIYRPSDCPKNLSKLWWQEITNGSYRYQISLPYVIWKTGINVGELPAMKPDVLKEYHHANEMETACA